MGTKMTHMARAELVVSFSPRKSEAALRSRTFGELFEGGRSSRQGICSIRSNTT